MFLMETNAVGDGVFTGIGSEFLGLEMSLHQSQNSSKPQKPHQLQPPQIVSYAHQEPRQSIKFSYAPTGAQQAQAVAPSDEDEPGFTADDGAGDGKKKISPWQRMKWTDTMVRLLIMAVFYIGDEGGFETTDSAAKKKSSGCLQKKGKWKSISRAMLEKGFYVSPQQCEDKFNDLNKRYKRVNDILGKGTACKVVENQGLLEAMDLSPKRKEEVKKLLNSKHLFFREMCAYHNSCSHSNGNASSGAHYSPEMAAEPSNAHHQQFPHQRCFHSSENASAMANLCKDEAERLKMVEDEYDEEDEESDSGDEDEAENEDVVEDDENDDRTSHKRRRKGFSASSSSSVQIQLLNSEIMGLNQDVLKTPWEKLLWIKNKLLELEEQKLGCLIQAFELEKQRLKWVKFSMKKEREMERARLENDRSKLLTEKMALLLRKKEMELTDLHHHHHQQQQQQQHSSSKRGDPSSITG